MKEHRDTIILVLLITAAAAFAWHGGAFLFGIVKWPAAVALVMGLAFMVGNEGGHVIKRWWRDTAWPWIQSRLPW
jgi:uncharacterized membrane protein